MQEVVYPYDSFTEMVQAIREHCATVPTMILASDDPNRRLIGFCTDPSILWKASRWEVPLDRFRFSNEEARHYFCTSSVVGFPSEARRELAKWLSSWNGSPVEEKWTKLFERFWPCSVSSKSLVAPLTRSERILLGFD